MYEPSKMYDSFDIAGFQYHDGALVLGSLKVGKKLDLVPEFDNPYDPPMPSPSAAKACIWAMSRVPGTPPSLSCFVSVTTTFSSAAS